MAVLDWGSAGAAGRVRIQGKQKMFKRIADDGHHTMLSRRRHMLRGSTALCAFIVALSFAGDAEAQSWLGGDGNWNEAAKWNPAGAPSAASSVFIGVTGDLGTITINTPDAAARGFTLGGGSELQVNGAGVLNTFAGISTIGGGGLGDGSMLIDGTGARWNATNGVRVGNGAAGTLTVSTGGALNMTGGLLSVGLNASGNGTLNINGGSIANGEALRLGFNGATGTLSITNGGTLVTSSSTVTSNTIGDGSGASPATGIMTISGAGSSWTIGQGALVLGSGADSLGRLTITDGGKLSYQNANGAVIVGYLGGTGEVLVSGANSLFESLDGLTIGNEAGSIGTFVVANGGSLTTGAHSLGVGWNGGTGTLVVDAGSVTAQNGLLIGAGSAVGLSAGSNGTVYVANGSTVTAAGIVVADSGAAGALNISSGSTVTATTMATVIGNGAGSDGTVTVDGSGSELNTLRIVVGNDTGVGKLIAANGAAVTAINDVIVGNSGATGTLDLLSGSTLTGTNLILGANSADASGTLNVSGGAQVNLTGSMNLGWNGATGTATVTGPGTRLTADGAIVIGHDLDGSAPSATGTLTVADGAIVKASAINVGWMNGTGILNIGDGAAAGIIDPATVYIAMSGASSTINFNHNEANYVFGTAINDVAGQTPASGSVNFIGTGTTTLTAVSNYTSATNVNAGKLVIASGASIADSILTTVNSGGTLSGAGGVGNVNVASGGTIAQSAGNTLTVKDITFAAGSTYQVGVTPNGQTGSIAANSATLNGGTVQVLAGSGNYAPGTSFTILSATAGVTGQFADAVNTNFAFLSAGLDYVDPNNVNLAITRNSTSFASVAQTQNQRATATGVGGLPAGNTVYDAVVQQDIGGARTAFDALSGEAHASAQGALINTSLIVGDTINNRLASGFGGDPLPGAPTTRAIGYAADAFASLNYADTNRTLAAQSPWMARKAPVVAPPPSVIYSLWAEGLGSWLNRSSDGNAASMRSSTAGIISGLDVTFWDTYRFGIAGGYTQSDISVGARASSLDADSYHISVYGGARQGRLGLQGGLIYSWNEIASNRTVMFPGFMDTVRSDYNAGTTHLFGETNYQFLVNGTALQTFAGFNYINHQTDSFVERGGAAALAVTGNDHDVVFTTLGLRSSAVLAQSGAFTLVGRGTLGWRHAFGDTDPVISAAFAGGAPFSVTGTPIATDAAYGEAGLDLNFSPAATLGVAWSGQFGNNISENRLKGQFVYRW